MEECEDFIDLAEIAMNVQQYDDAKEYISEYVKNSNHLSEKARNKFAQIWSYLLKERVKWRNSLLKKAEEENDEITSETLKKCAIDVENNIISLSEEGINIIRNELKNKDLIDDEIFHYKFLLADFQYVLLPLSSSKVNIEDIRLSYEDAYKLAVSKEWPSSSLYLQLVLNYSYFLINCVDNKEYAKEILTKAFNQEVEETYTLDVSYQPSSLLSSISTLLSELK